MDGLLGHVTDVCVLVLWAAQPGGVDGRAEDLVPRDVTAVCACVVGGLPDHAAQPRRVDGRAEDLVPRDLAGRDVEADRAQVH